MPPIIYTLYQWCRRGGGQWGATAAAPASPLFGHVCVRIDIISLMNFVLLLKYYCAIMHHMICTTPHALICKSSSVLESF